MCEASRHKPTGCSLTLLQDSQAPAFTKNSGTLDFDDDAQLTAKISFFLHLKRFKKHNVLEASSASIFR